MRGLRSGFLWAGLLAIGLIWSGSAASAEKTKTPPAAASSTTADQKTLDAVWAQVYDRPERLKTLDHPVVCFLDIQHPEVIRGQLPKPPKPASEARADVMRQRFRTLSGLECLVFHQTEVVGADLEHSQIRALLISGRSKTLSRARDEQFFDLIRTTKIPIIGFCGGCQLIGQAYAAKVAAMRKLRDGEQDPNPKYHPGLFKEWGFLPVAVGRSDPLFANLPKELLVKEAHAYHMLELPKEFDLLASTAECRVEALKHRERVLYGVQFHPEAYDDAHPDGRRILENFFRIALGK